MRKVKCSKVGCKHKFYPLPKSKIYCSDECRKASFYIKRKVKKKDIQQEIEK